MSKDVQIKKTVLRFANEVSSAVRLKIACSLVTKTLQLMSMKQTCNVFKVALSSVLYKQLNFVSKSTNKQRFRSPKVNKTKLIYQYI